MEENEITPRKSPKLSAKQLSSMIEEAATDACNEAEQVTGFLAAMVDHLELPFVTQVLGRSD